MRAMTISYLTPSREHLEQLNRIASGMRVAVVALDSLSELERQLGSDEPSAILTDCQLPDGDWRDVIAISQSRSTPVPVVVTAQTDSASLWSEVAEAGARDLLARPFYPAEVRQCFAALQEERSTKQLAEATI